MKETNAQRAEKEIPQRGLWARIKTYLKILGPGLITGASDDDPSGIGTYSQTGAQFGFTQLWSMLYTLPLTVAIQEMCARIALQTGAGLAHTIRQYYPRWILYLCVSLLIIANTINVGADLGAMAASAQLLADLPFWVWLVGATILIVALEIWVPYNQYTRFLRILTLSLFAYVLVAFSIKLDWGAILRSTLIPTLVLQKDFLLNLVAVLGTTISPYLFFWQASQEVEEEIRAGKKTINQRRGVTYARLKVMRTDVASGMIISNVVAWFIIITTASTLHANGITHIDSATKAAQALRPIAGPYASWLFASGIIGAGLLAVPVLAGSAAYAVADTFKLPQGLSLKLPQAPVFYTVIAISTVVGAAINLAGINPITALYYTAVLNGLISPPLLFMLMLIGSNRQIMKDKANSRLSNTIGWITTAVMTLSALALLVSLWSG